MQRALLDYDVWCPWSGALLNGKRVPTHKLKVMRCGNGTLFSICQLHKCRVFTADLNTIASVVKSATVIEITERPVRMLRKREI